MKKNTLDDSSEFIFKDDKLGKINFSSGFQTSVLFRFATVANYIITHKKSDNVKILDIGSGYINFYKFWTRNFDSPSKFAIDYTALDLNPEYLEKFKKEKDILNKNRDKVELKNIFLNKETLKDFDKYDFVICMEIIEHMSEKDGDELLECINFILKDSGTLFLSSPNPKKHKGNNFVWPENHIYEYSLSEIKTLLSKRFNILNIFGWLGKARKFKKIINYDTLILYNKLKHISSGVASSIIAYLNPEIAECYLIIADKIFDTDKKDINENNFF